ncbi:hypothetical protein ACP70R_050119 [Stipagrostis hirtigluma subsp. patula]
MSVAVCRAVAPPPNPIWMPAAVPINLPGSSMDSSLWTAIHADAQVSIEAEAARTKLKPRSLVMTPASLQLCTETLGCETGSEDTTPMPMAFLRPTTTSDHREEEEEEEEAAAAASLVVMEEQQKQEESTVESPEEELSNGVHYHCSRPRRAFPPPLRSISRRDGPCRQLRPHRRDGRLVLEAVPARPHAYLHARRQGGRLRLCFVHYCSSATEQTSSSSSEPEGEQDHEQGQALQEVEEDEEVEVEVVDRGTEVEVKAQVRSRLVINKFVAGEALLSVDGEAGQPPSRSVGLRPLAAAVASASTGIEKDEQEEEVEEAEEKSTTALLLTSRELVQSVRQCRQLRHRPPLFIVEPHCATIATS